MLRRWRRRVALLLLCARRRGWLWPGIVIIAAVVGGLTVAWLVDDVARGTSIPRNHEVSGIEIGGLDPEQAAEALEPVRRDVAATVLELRFQDRTVILTAEELGIALDTERTLSDAEDRPPRAVRPAAWLFDLIATTEVEPAIITDLEQLEGAVVPYTDPETPRIDLVDGAWVPVTSTEVPVPDMEHLAQVLEQAVQGAAGGAVTIDVPISGMVPADPTAVELATTLAAQANEITAGGAVLQLEGSEETFHIGELALRGFIVLEGELHETRLGLDDRLAETLSSLFVGIGAKGSPATITLDETGAVVISGGEPGFKCCSETAVEAVLWGLSQDLEVVSVPAEPAPHPKGREWAESLGITEVVGEFTTNFHAGQDRVINIARISELTRGAIIEPGQRFSVNKFVGPRTESKGFVSAGMISNGVFVDSVGGGISQYATTLFNAAFFAGLDFVDYQSHTIYLSRYPYGREATVSYPAPDLVIENNTPYAVMLWPTTTDTSITAKLYSTRWVAGEQTNQWTRARGTSCTRVTTERTRTWVEDGRTETDTVWAQYRPEGLKCDGTPSVTTLPETVCTAGCEE